MRVIVDSDSMPVRIREIIARQADRRGFMAVFFANHPVPLPASRNVERRIVEDADDAMVEDAAATDLAVTHDVPLAARLIEKGLTVLDERGGRFAAGNIGERLSSRDFASELREAGLLKQRGRAFGRKEVQMFANALDRELTALGRQASGDGASPGIGDGKVDNAD